MSGRSGLLLRELRMGGGLCAFLGGGGVGDIYPAFCVFLVLRVLFFLGFFGWIFRNWCHQYIRA